METGKAKHSQLLKNSTFDTGYMTGFYAASSLYIMRFILWLYSVFMFIQSGELSAGLCGCTRNAVSHYPYHPEILGNALSFAFFGPIFFGFPISFIVVYLTHNRINNNSRVLLTVTLTILLQIVISQSGLF